MLQENTENTHQPSFASSASSFPYKTQQQLLNMIGILPITTSVCKNRRDIEKKYMCSSKYMCQQQQLVHTFSDWIFWLWLPWIYSTSALMGAAYLHYLNTGQIKKRTKPFYTSIPPTGMGMSNPVKRKTEKIASHGQWILRQIRQSTRLGIKLFTDTIHCDGRLTNSNISKPT